MASEPSVWTPKWGRLQDFTIAGAPASTWPFCFKLCRAASCALRPADSRVKGYAAMANPSHAAVGGSLDLPKTTAQLVAESVGTILSG